MLSDTLLLVPSALVISPETAKFIVPILVALQVILKVFVVFCPSEVTLTESTKTLEIQNARPAYRTINLTDQNYNNLPIMTANITLS